MGFWFLSSCPLGSCLLPVLYQFNATGPTLFTGDGCTLIREEPSSGFAPKLRTHGLSVLLHGKPYFKSFCIWCQINEMGGWEIIVKPLNLDASSIFISKGLCDLSKPCWGSHLTALIILPYFVTSSPMTNRFPIGLALKAKKNHHHHPPPKKKICAFPFSWGGV